MSLNDDIDVLLHRELPDSRKVLSSNIFNLQQIANYCDENYIQVIFNIIYMFITNFVIYKFNLYMSILYLW